MQRPAIRASPKLINGQPDAKAAQGMKKGGFSSGVDSMGSNSNGLQIDSSRWRGRRISKVEFIAQDIATTHLVDGGLAEPTLAAHFAAGSGLTRGHGLGERRTQIKIAGDTFAVKTIETEH